MYMYKSGKDITFTPYFSLPWNHLWERFVCEREESCVSRERAMTGTHCRVNKALGKPAVVWRLWEWALPLLLPRNIVHLHKIVVLWSRMHTDAPFFHLLFTNVFFLTNCPLTSLKTGSSLFAPWHFWHLGSKAKPAAALSSSPHTSVCWILRVRPER